MSDNFVGEIRMFAGTYAPADWAMCDGQLLTIQQNEVLFSLIGVRFGGIGTTSFNLPDLRGRLPVHQGTSQQGTHYPVGMAFGSETVTLTEAAMPPHTHALLASGDTADAPEATGRLFADTGDSQAYTAEAGNPVPFAGAFLAEAGGAGGSTQPHDNRMPALCVNFIIALNGYYPVRD